MTISASYNFTTNISICRYQYGNLPTQCQLCSQDVANVDDYLILRQRKLVVNNRTVIIVVDRKENFYFLKGELRSYE